MVREIDRCALFNFVWRNLNNADVSISRQVQVDWENKNVDIEANKISPGETLARTESWKGTLEREFLLPLFYHRNEIQQRSAKS